MSAKEKPDDWQTTSGAEPFFPPGTCCVMSEGEYVFVDSLRRELAAARAKCAEAEADRESLLELRETILFMVTAQCPPASAEAIAQELRVWQDRHVQAAQRVADEVAKGVRGEKDEHS